MEGHWPKPVLVFKQVMTDWLGKLVLEGTALNLFFDIGNALSDTDGPEFERSHAMLPNRWKELYRWFWSFGITRESYLGLQWKNTPLTYGSRLDLKEYVKYFDGEIKKAIEFEKHVGSALLRCWMVTDTGDSLWLDEFRCDKKVYFIPKGKYEQAMALPDPEDKLDSYLAHVVSGGAPGDFNLWLS